MARIKVLGGTGFAGGAVVQEAARRGHEVTAYSRKPPTAPVPGVEYVSGSALDGDVLRAVVSDADVVIEAISPRGDMEGKLEALTDELISLADQNGVRLGVIGGASSLLVEEGGPRFVDVNPPPPENEAEILVGLKKLDAYKQAPPSLDWFYISPPIDFGSWLPQRSTGTYRVSDDVLLKDDNGDSYISGADFALAIVDEIEIPRHKGKRFHAAL